MSTSIKIKLIFNGKSCTVEVPRNKQFKILREKAQSFFFPIPKSYLFYEKKNAIEIDENKILGQVFGTRNQIILTIKEVSNYIMTKKSISATPSKKIFCQECTEHPGTIEVSYYCRTCDSLICKNCRLNIEKGKHYSHTIIQLFNNNDGKDIKRNTELYKQLIMNDVGILKTKINKFNNIKNKQVDFVVWKKILYEKIELISKLLLRKKQLISQEEDKESQIKDTTELTYIRNELDYIRDDNNIQEITNDPLIEFPKINEFDKRLISYKKNFTIQKNNEKLINEINNTENQVTDLFNKICPQV